MSAHELLFSSGKSAGQRNTATSASASWSHSSFALEKVDEELLFGARRESKDSQSSHATQPSMSSLSTGARGRSPWLSWCCCAKRANGTSARFQKSTFGGGDETLLGTADHEILFGAGDYHEVDLERRFVEELLLSNPSTFPPLCSTPSLSVVLAALLLTAYVLLALLLPAHVITSIPFPLEDPPDDDHEEALWIRKKLLAYASIPVVSCLFTYFHIWLALWMMFYPLEFIGVGRLPGTNVGVPGWQGIVPFKAKKMIHIATNLILAKLVDVRTEFKRVKPRVLSSILEAPLSRQLEEILPIVFARVRPDLWSILPTAVQQAFISAGTERCASVSEAIFTEMQDRIEELVDLSVTVQQHFEKNKASMVDMFIRCGYQELKFIRNSGAILGFAFGLIQMGVWVFWHPEKERALDPSVQSLVVFPVFGLVVGSLTNALSLKVIFEPIEPTYVCGVKLHGLFLQRQREVSAVYGRLAGTEVLTAKRLVAAIVNGSSVGGSDTFREIIRRHFDLSFDEILQSSIVTSLGSKLVLSEKDIAQLREETIQMLLQTMPEIMSHKDVVNYVEGSIQIEQTLRSRMEKLPHRDFDGMLHPIFQEDEWKLVLLGGALGVAIGLVQSYFIN